METLANVAIVLDTRRPKSTGLYPVKLRLTIKRSQRYYPLNLDLTPEAFKRAKTESPRNEYRKWHDQFIQEVAKVNEILATLPWLTFDRFEKEYLGESFRKDTIDGLYQAHIDMLYEEKRIKTAMSYHYSLKSLLQFRNPLRFEEITVPFLKDYERWMLENGKSRTTVGYHLRALKAIVNIAITEKVFPQDAYPFGNKKYQIPSPVNIKKALNTDEIRRIIQYRPESGSPEETALDFWTFSFLCNGINFKDIACLKNKNIDGDSIQLFREKTKNTDRINSKPIVVTLHPMIQEIIDRQKAGNNGPDDYVFPILRFGFSAVQIVAEVQQFVKTTNKYMKRIAKTVGIQKVVTTYVARHSFATTLLRLEKPVELIYEMINHQSIQTTKRYLAGFEDDYKKRTTEELVRLITAIQRKMNLVER